MSSKKASKWLPVEEEMLWEVFCVAAFGVIPKTTVKTLMWSNWMAVNKHKNKKKLAILKSRYKSSIKLPWYSGTCENNWLGFGHGHGLGPQDILLERFMQSFKRNYWFPSRNIGIHKQTKFTHENFWIYVFSREGEGEGLGDIRQNNYPC